MDICVIVTIATTLVSIGATWFISRWWYYKRRRTQKVTPEEIELKRLQLEKRNELLTNSNVQTMVVLASIAVVAVATTFIAYFFAN